MAHNDQPAHPRSILLPVAVLALTVFLWPALVTFNAGDWPSPNQAPHNSPSANACGVVGAWSAYQLRYFLGYGAYPLLLFATLAAFLRAIRGEIGHFAERVFGLTLVVLCTAASMHLIPAKTAAALPVGDGGILGYALGEVLTANLSRVGTLIVLAASLFVGLVFATEGWVLKLPSFLKRAGQASGRVVAVARASAAATIARPVPAAEGIAADRAEAVIKVKRPEPKINPNRPQLKKKGKEEEQGTLFDKDGAAGPTKAAAPLAKEPGVEVPPHAGDEADPGTPAKAEKSAKSAPGPKVNVLSPQRIARAGAYPRQIENWRLPALHLLHEPAYGFTTQQEVKVREQAKVLERTLEEFRLDAHVVEIDTGPVITMFELKLGAGIKVSQIATLSNDIARALKAHAIRVVAPISGKNTVGIEVPNIRKETVRLKELMMLAGKQAANMGLPLFFGKDAGGAALVADLTKMPHLLIAGTTGSGKSVCLNAITLSLLMTKRPDHVKMILVDPKMVEMSQFKDVPHLMCPIVTDMFRAEKILEWAVTKMEERYELIAEARVKSVAAYNRLGADEIYRRLKPRSREEKALISTHVPYIVIIIDELADLMMTSAKEVEHHLSRLAQKSRAVGIHIIVATQRPEARIVTGLIKSNLPSRICFRVASRIDSRIVLDQNGGEVLLGQGDMLFLPPGSHKLLRAQGTFLEDGEIQAVLNDLAARAKPEFHPELVRIKSPDADVDSGLRDPLFDEAVRMILETKRGSVSLLQRRLEIGYSRASRLIDQMADAGIVGEYKGSVAREVLISPKEWGAMRKQVTADLEEDYAADRDDDQPEPNVDPADDEVPALSDNHDIRG